MKFRIKDLEKYLQGVKINWNKLSKELTQKSFETTYQNGVLEVDILPNRYSDSASLVGLAKEISVVTGSKIKEPKVNFYANSNKLTKRIDADIKKKTKKPKIKVINQTKYCPYYFGRIILNVQNRSSPQWLKEFVEFYGFNSINFLVDLANFAMIEYGAPLHIFDLDKIKNNIYVRLAKKGESFVSLENKEYELLGDEIVIADDEKILGLAGIKGAKNSEVTLETSNIFIEAAVFDPEKIYITSRKLNLRTDASFRFERKVAPVRSIKALNRVTDMIIENLGGMLFKSYLGNKKLSSQKIIFNFEKVEKLTGLKIAKEEILKILTKVFDKVNYINKNKKVVLSVPLDRFDLRTEEDVVEEVIRIYDLNNIKSVYESSVREIFVDEILEFKSYLRKILTLLGFSEGQNYNFFGDKERELIQNNLLIQDNFKNIEVLNPVSENYKYFQSTLIFNLLKSVHLNQFHSREIKIFEISKIAWAQKDIIEKNRLGIVYAFDNNEVILKKLKGVLSCLENELQLKFSFQEFSDNLFSLGAKIYVNNDYSGFIGIIAQNHLINFDIDLNVGIIELDIETLMHYANLNRFFQPLPIFPQIIRDISFFVDEKIKFSDLKKDIEKLKIKFLTEIKLVDIYFKEKKSMTLRFVFSNPDRSLTDKEVNEELVKIENYLKTKFNVQFR
jgi:phenylalanyl-tRNA synthetase beta chain